MDQILSALKLECDRAARDFLSIEGWASPKWKIRLTIEDLIAGSERSSPAMSRLLREVTKVPTHFEPNRRLYELVQAVNALRNREKALAYSGQKAESLVSADQDLEVVHA